MTNLIELLRQCQADTKRVISPGAANALGVAIGNATTEDDLIAMVKRMIRVRENAANGWSLYTATQRGLSLEEIVLDRLPDLFNAADHAIAEKTLGRDKKTKKGGD